MKISKKIKNVLVWLVVFATILVFSSFIKESKAQEVFDNINLGNITRTASSNSMSGIMGGLEAVIKQLPGCMSAVKDGGGVKNLFKNNGTNSKSNTDTKNSDLNSTASNAGAGSDAVNVVAPKTDLKLEAQGKDIKTLLSAANETKKSTASMDKNDNCTNAIGKAIIKSFIQKMTADTVNWITNGFGSNGKGGGDPFFVQEPGKYFRDLQKTEILKIKEELKDPNKYPFGSSFLMGISNNYNNKFADNAQYSLDKVIQGSNPGSTSSDFKSDFSKGGWGAWSALTQNPANNPLGFQIMASEELASRQETQQAFETAQLAQSGGFLGDIRCANPTGVTKEEDQQALSGKKGARRCLEWAYATPGKIIAEKMSAAVKYNDQPLLDANTLNDAVAAILDATMARFSSELMEHGISKLPGLNNEDTINTEYNDNGMFSDGGNQVANDFPPSLVGEWLDTHPDFNIRTDLNQALIDEQRTYLEMLKNQNEILPELVKTINQLDYCIPGPHPGWEEEAQTSLQNTMDEWKSKFLAPSSMISNFLSGLGIPSGSIQGIIDDAAFCGSADKQQEAKYYAKTVLSDLTGIGFVSLDGHGFDWSELRPKTNAVFCERSAFENLLWYIFDSHASLLNERYGTLENLPSVTPEARTLFEKTTGYQEMIKDNEQNMGEIRNVVNKLQEIKNGVDLLNTRLSGITNPTSQDQEAYQEDLKPLITQFGRISSYMVSGDQIATANRIYKEALDERDYVLNDLIQGPNGCEMELKNLKTQLKFWQDWTVVRPTYPRPHLYDGFSPVTGYNYSRSIDQKTAKKNDNSNVGFLNSVIFWDWSACGDPTNTTNPDHRCGGGTGQNFFNNPHVISGIIDLSKFLKLNRPGFDGSAGTWERSLGIY